MEEFERWLRTVCFQKPTPEAYDLARDAWEEAWNTRSTPDNVKDIEWVGKCDTCEDGQQKCGDEEDPYYTDCPDCNGTGEIRRAATIDEVLKKEVGRIKLIQTMIEFNIMGSEDAKQALTINNGRLRIKEEV